MKYILFILLFFACKAQGQISISTEDAESDCGSGTTVTTSLSISVASNEVAILFVHSRNSTGGLADPSSITGGGVTTWEKITSTTFDGGNRQLTVYRGVGGAAGAAIVATWAVAQNQKYISCYSITGAPTTNNGADAVIQSPVDAGTAESSLAITMAALQARSGVLTIYSANAFPVTGSADAGFTEHQDINADNCFALNRWLYEMSDNLTTNNNPTVTASAAVDWAGIAIEIKSNPRRRIIID